MLGLLFAVLLVLIDGVHAEPICPTDQPRRIHIGTQSFNVSLASSDKEHEQGLSGRAALLSGSGMWFVFSEPGYYGFWMQDMHFPIDLVWIGPAHQVLGAIRLQPCEDQICPIHLPPAPISYVLEINAGTFSGKPGDIATWDCSP